MRIPNKFVRREWTKAEDKLLGTMPDFQVARRLRRSLSSVQRRCYKLRISKPRPTYRRWTRAEEKLLGTYPTRKPPPA